MATRSRIGIWTEDRKIKSVYCHWDGYPSNNGKLLLENYNTKEKVEALIALDDMYFLKKSIECPKGHSFENKIDGYSLFYHRDRGEDWNSVKPLITTKAEGMPGEEYDYLFDPQTNEWKYRYSKNWFKLTSKVCEM